MEFRRLPAKRRDVTRTSPLWPAQPSSLGYELAELRAERPPKAARQAYGCVRLVPFVAWFPGCLSPSR
jgi:hypothetical protein